MKTIVLLCLLALAVLSAADETDVEDLGEITARRGIQLTACQRRTDFMEFRIVFFPQTAFKNPIPLTTTNDLILLSDLARLPSGPTIMAVQSVCRDSAESPVAFYRFEIMRSEPSAPKAKAIGVLVPDLTPSASDALKQIQLRKAAEAATTVPPTPGQTVTNAPPQGRALPDSTPRTYAEHLDDQARFYSRQSRK